MNKSEHDSLILWNICKESDGFWKLYHLVYLKKWLDTTALRYIIGIDFQILITMYLCQQVQEIANGLSANAEYVDWRRFLIAIAQPLPSPTQTELLETLQKFKEMDQKSTGCVTREQYDRVSS